MKRIELQCGLWLMGELNDCWLGKVSFFFFSFAGFVRSLQCASFVQLVQYGEYFTLRWLQLPLRLISDGPIHNTKSSLPRTYMIAISLRDQSYILTMCLSSPIL